MAGFEYKTNIDSIINVLKAHNTTTASPDLSASLTSRINDDNIIADDPEVVEWRSDRLPSIFVRLANKSEEFAGLGATGGNGAQKEATVNFDVIGLYGFEGGYSTYSGVLNEVYVMARNIEAVMQKEFTLSGTALYCNCNKTNFLNPWNLEGAWIKSFVIELEANYLFR